MSHSVGVGTSGRDGRGDGGIGRIRYVERICFPYLPAAMTMTTPTNNDISATGVSQEWLLPAVVHEMLTALQVLAITTAIAAVIISITSPSYCHHDHHHRCVSVGVAAGAIVVTS